MAALNLSVNGPSISKSYQAVINSTLPISGTGSPTHGQWAIFSVSTPLTNAFQQDSGSKESVMKVQDTGAGELVDLIDEFSEGKIQFAYVKVTDPNTGLPKNVLIAWCGEGVPERTKGYFTSHLSAVSKFLHGYHVQITARSEGDLTADGIIHKVGDASGAKYTPSAAQQRSLTPVSPVSTKPAFTPSRTTGIALDAAAAGPLRPVQKRDGDDDGWGPNAPPVTRTELEKVQPAYKPTKVNMEDLKSDNKFAAKAMVQHTPDDRGDIVKGGYQPIGKVDIAAIRRQAREASGIDDDRPEPVKGAYQPVGKVDIAAIRSKAKLPGSPPSNNEPRHTAPVQAPGPAENENFPGGSSSSGDSERLQSLPKPKVSNKFGAASSFAGTKPPLPSSPALNSNPTTVQIGGASRTFADEGGKTPAQLWAERKARAREQDMAPPSSHQSNAESAVQSHHSDKGEWKSSYSGKSWAPVQTTHTGKSFGSEVSSAHQTSDYVTSEEPQADTRTHLPSVSVIREQIDHGPSFERPSDHQAVPITDHNATPEESRKSPVDLEITHEPVAHQILPTRTRQDRSPGPLTPVRESSPIRVAVPIGKGIEDTNDEKRSPASPTTTLGLQENITGYKELEEENQDSRRATAEETPDNDSRTKGIHALVQYDYEKAEDNEIDLKEGEYVADIEMVDKDWWLGSNSHGDRGLFPSNYVEVIADRESEVQGNEPETDSAAISTEIESPPAPVTEPTATALYDYEAAEDNELSFPEGAEITKIEFPDDDWWFGVYLDSCP
ncbi:actin binding protein [Aspergillus heteromorphus CBS 117.55]|uniref:Actin binding protein n=1 Tax=Aspergillus heteromorphus CBS 117.55 TaxID=1448321 RepID=A0A317UQ68_9EURO|nr:actin binding protein [Aspergillus heteromorphus CBS 117.55]PWY63695.1 actin binding protein [Aspergillus heteromorphus CBS 117.55]